MSDENVKGLFVGDAPPEEFDVDERGAYHHISKGGEDTLYLNLKVHWGNKFNFLIADLKRLKEVAQKSAQENLKSVEEEIVYDEEKGVEVVYRHEIVDLPELHINGHTLVISPNGMNPGKSKFSNYAYVASEHGFRYLISGRNLRDTTASGNLYIMIGSLALMKWGVLNCYTILRHTIEKMGGSFSEEDVTVSRADFCVDLPGVSVEPFYNAVMSGRYVCRAKTFSNFLTDQNPDTEENQSFYRYGKRPTGFTIGRGNIICRVYDKLFESRNDEEKTFILQTCRWGGELPTCATRVEFQLRREALRSFSVSGVCFGVRLFREFLQARGAIMEYLCTRWLRLYSKKIDRSHTARLQDKDLLPEWAVVQACFRSVAAGDHQTIRIDKKTTQPDKVRLLRQGFGCFSSIIAQTDLLYQDKTCIRRQVFDLVDRFLEATNTETIKRSITRKKMLHGARVPLLQGVLDVPF